MGLCHHAHNPLWHWRAHSRFCYYLPGVFPWNGTDFCQKRVPFLFTYYHLVYNWEYITLKRWKFISKLILDCARPFLRAWIFLLLLCGYFVLFLEIIHFKNCLSHYFTHIAEHRQTDAWSIGPKPMATKFLEQLLTMI